MDKPRYTLPARDLEQDMLRDVYHDAWVDLQRTKAGSEKLRDILARLKRQAEDKASR